MDRSKTSKATAAETLARGIVQSEVEKRKLMDKLAQKITLGTLAASARRLVTLSTSGTLDIISIIADRCGDLTLHQLITVGLAILAFN